MEDRSNGRVSSSGAPTAPPGSHPGWGLRRAGTQVRHRPMGDEDPVHHHPDRDPRKPDHRLPDPVDPDAVGVTDLPGRLESLVRSTPWLLEALRAAKNQAAVHTWYGRVFGGRVAPCGLDGLFGLVCRRNPAGSPSPTTTSGSATSAWPIAGRRSRSSWRAKMRREEVGDERAGTPRRG